MSTVMLKRLIVWFFEMLSELPLLGLLLILASTGHGLSHVHPGDLLFAVYAIAYAFMWRAGYLLTTGLLRILWSNRRPWLHPVVSVLLFSIHLQIVLASLGGTTMPARLALKAAGACIVFACTFA